MHPQVSHFPVVLQNVPRGRWKMALLASSAMRSRQKKYLPPFLDTFCTFCVVSWCKLFHLGLFEYIWNISHWIIHLSGHIGKLCRCRQVAVCPKNFREIVVNNHVHRPVRTQKVLLFCYVFLVLLFSIFLSMLKDVTLGHLGAKHFKKLHHLFQVLFNVKTGWIFIC